jgi:hypothetical protein
MNDQNESELSARVRGSGPDIRALIAEFRAASPWEGNNLKFNEDVRFCRWAGKTPDGKKHGISGKTAFPWENGSDLDPHLADELIEFLVALSYLAFWKAWLGLKGGGTEESNYAVKLADWIINNLLEEELGLVEVELSENYRQTYGWVVLYVQWVVELSLRYEKLTLEDIAGRLSADAFAEAESPDVLKLFGAMVMEPAYEGQVVELLRRVCQQYREEAVSELSEAHTVEVPALEDRILRDILKQLREQKTVNGQTVQECKVPTPCLKKNGPEICALKPWRDVVLKSTVADAKKSRIVWHLEYIDEAEADARIVSRKWNRGFVEALKKQKGKLSTWSTGGTVDDPKPTSLSSAMSGDGQPWVYCEPNGMKDLIQVVTAVYRQNDENGVPGLWATVFHPAIGGAPKAGGATSATTSEYAEHGLVDGDEAGTPYVVGRREVPDRSVSSSRGLPQLVNAWQRTEKGQLDGMLDLLSIGVHPPQEIYENVFSSQYVWAPGEQNMVKRGFEPRFPDVPLKGLAPSAEMVELCERRAGRRAGRRHADIDPSESATLTAKNTETFLMMWSAAIKRAVCLCQAHMSDAEFARITGAPAGWLEERRYERGAQLDTKLEFDVRELDPEYVRELIKTINEGILPDDVMGITNRAKLTKWKWRLVNPRLARELVDDEGAASQKMMDDVMLQVALMWQGNEPKYVENDASAMQKLNFLQQIVMANPNYAQSVQASMQGQQPPNPRFVELLQKYNTHLMFQKEQMVDNRQIGRIGVKPQETAGEGM